MSFSRMVSCNHPPWFAHAFHQAYQHLRDDVSVRLVHGGPELLPAMDKELRARALKALEAQGVEVRLNTRLNEVGRGYTRIGEKGSDAEETIPLGITVWAAGNAPVPFVRELLSQLPEGAAGSGGRRGGQAAFGGDNSPHSTVAPHQQTGSPRSSRGAPSSPWEGPQ